MYSARKKHAGRFSSCSAVREHGRSYQCQSTGAKLPAPLSCPTTCGCMRAGAAAGGTPGGERGGGKAAVRQPGHGVASGQGSQRCAGGAVLRKPPAVALLPGGPSLAMLGYDSKAGWMTHSDSQAPCRLTSFCTKVLVDAPSAIRAPCGHWFISSLLSSLGPLFDRPGQTLNYVLLDHLLR